MKSISINGDTVASGSWDETCQVWSISKQQQLHSLEHGSTVEHVRLFSDQKLGFDLITSSWDKTVKFWRQGQIVKSLQHSRYCYRFDIDKDNRLLAVATGKDKNGGVSLYRLDTFAKIDEKEIGCTEIVRFNSSATKLIAVKHKAVFELSLQ